LAATAAESSGIGACSSKADSYGTSRRSAASFGGRPGSNDARLLGPNALRELIEQSIPGLTESLLLAAPVESDAQPVHRLGLEGRLFLIVGHARERLRRLAVGFASE